MSGRESANPRASSTCWCRVIPDWPPGCSGAPCRSERRRRKEWHRATTCSSTPSSTSARSPASAPWRVQHFEPGRRLGALLPLPHDPLMESQRVRHLDHRACVNPREPVSAIPAAPGQRVGGLLPRWCSAGYLRHHADHILVGISRCTGAWTTTSMCTTSVPMSSVPDWPSYGSMRVAPSRPPSTRGCSHWIHSVDQLYQLRLISALVLAAGAAVAGLLARAVMGRHSWLERWLAVAMAAVAVTTTAAPSFVTRRPTGSGNTIDSADGREELRRAGEDDVERGPPGGRLVLDLLRGDDDDAVELQALGVQAGEYDDAVLAAGRHP